MKNTYNSDVEPIMIIIMITTTLFHLIFHIIEEIAN